MEMSQNDYEILKRKQQEYDEIMEMYKSLEDFNSKKKWPDIIKRVTLCSFYIDIILSETEH